jgi:uncharacterized protein (TIGR02996 family)
MNDETFLHAIIADPDDDTVRLAYCDWLEENAAEKKRLLLRAEFIRGQIALARQTEDSPSRRKLALRIRRLLDRHGSTWIGPLRKHLHEWHYHRGFPDQAGLSAGTLSQQATQIFRSLPLRRLRVMELNGNLSCLRDIPDGHALTSLDLSCNNLSSRALEQLTALPWCGQLRQLILMFNHIDDTGAMRLVRHPCFQGLSLLRCGGNPISPATREVLRSHFGERVSFDCERDDDHLYALQDDHAFTTGVGDGDTQLLFRSWEAGLRLAIFDHEGNLLDIQSRDVLQQEGADWTQRARKQTACLQAWKKELGFRSARIQIKRFRFDDGERIYGFNWWQEAFDDPNHPQADIRGSVEGWLRDGQFEWKFRDGDNCWIDGTGEVTDT